ncbi:MAG: gliding motility-associated C-terminal domain-containing protein [Bacteroidetes bacterium]|nr:gliding motility-associated C-terminal domain-containing protein [Bacteroidota bacterium]
MKKLFLTFLYLFVFIYSVAQPGKDGSLTVASGSNILNHYIPISVDIATGSNVVTIASTSLFSLCPGDLIMVYQAQGAGMNITNTNSYGNITAYNSAGLYEFKYVQSVSGNNVTTQTTFTNSYAVAGRAQIIKVPQYTNLTINAGVSIVPKPWKDTTIAATAYRFGGLIVLHATNIINNGTIAATDFGFRGGALFNNNTIIAGVTAFRSTLSSQGGEKGESIFGYQTDYDGLNGGRYCLGAPANAGGGGDGHNAGGGGGGNGFNGNTWTGQGVMVVNASNALAAWALSSGYIANGNALTTSSGGGHGGYSYGDANANATIQGPGNSAWVGDTRREVGGVGGRPLSNINSENRIYFGGGGGSPHADNNATPPATNGGGIVYLIATGSISGNGIISSNSSNVGNSSGCNCDGLSGAGAGGSIVIKTGAIPTTQVVSANGGNGGNQMFPVSPSNANESEGPGGGGGGGFVAISIGAIVPQINGGLNGTSLSNAVANEMTSNGATQGAIGQTGPVSTAFVSFIPIVVAPSSGSAITACAGAILNLTTTAGASTYFWSGPNSFTSSIQNPFIPNANASTSGIYTVTQNFSGCLPPTAYTTTVTIDPVPTPIITNSGNNAICSGQSINLSGGGGVTYLWSGPSSFTSSSQNVSINPATASNGGNYTLTVFSVNGCSATSVSPIVIAPSPTVSVTGASVCVNQPINIIANSSASSFSWTGPNGFNSAAQAVNFSNAGFNLSGVYTITVTSAQGCTNTAAATISVYPLPTPSLSSNSPVCIGGSLNFNGTGSATYLYTGPNGFTSSLQNPSINNVTSAASGIYTLTASNFGCSASVTHSVSIFGSNVGTLTASHIEECIPFCSTFSINTNGSPATSASLSVNGQLFFGNPVNYCITAAGNYTINSTFKDASGCVSSSTIQVTGYPKPNADFTFSPLKPIENLDQILFTNTSTGINQTSWNWFFSNNNGFTSSNQNTFYMFDTAGAYPVAMIVKNVWGCADTVVKVIVIEDDFSFYIPNTFTPNGDGLNEIFQPKGHGIKNYTLEIFDRWGEKIFTSNDFYIGWDGTFKGKKCQIDTYTWKIDLTNPKGRTKIFTGHVNIVE